MMNDYAKRIADAKEAGDFEEIKKMQVAMLSVTFAETYIKQLTDSPYFPGLNPSLAYPGPPTFFQQTYTCNPGDNLDFAVILVPYDEEAIKEITDYDFISLFEAALLIGYRVDNDPRGILDACPELFADAIVNRLIDPREPFTHIPYSKLNKTIRLVGDKIAHAREIPDMSWQLTLKEAAEFAILKGYPEHLFTDLLSDTPTESNQTPSEPMDNKHQSETMKKNAKPTKPTPEEGRPQDRIKTLQKIILGMAIDAYGYMTQTTQKTKQQAKKAVVLQLLCQK